MCYFRVVSLLILSRYTIHIISVKNTLSLYYNNVYMFLRLFIWMQKYIFVTVCISAYYKLFLVSP